MPLLDPASWKVPRSHGARLLVRATLGATDWMREHFKWELLLVLCVGLAAWLYGVIAGAEKSWFEQIAVSLGLGFASWGLLWFIVWVVKLVAAPRGLRERRRRQPLATFRGVVRGASTLLGEQAMGFIPRLQKFSQDRQRLMGLGPANEGHVLKVHKEILKSIEHFGSMAATADRELASRHEQRRALMLYQQIRGFPVDADVEILVDAIRSFAIRPRRWSERWDDYLYRLRGSVF